MTTVIILPRVSHAPLPAIDLANQRLAPSSDRRNVTELWRVRLEREQSELTREGGQNG